MKTLIAVSKNNGESCLLIPLYPDHADEIEGPNGWRINISAHPPKPLAYVVDIDDGHPQVFNAKFIEIQLDILEPL